MRKPVIAIATLASAAAVLIAFHQFSSRGRAIAVAEAQPPPVHRAPAGASGGTVVVLCDGVTKTEVPGLKPGHPMSRAQALAVTGRLMDEWRRKHPDRDWSVAQNDQGASASGAAAGSSNIAGPGAPAAPSLKSQQGDTYASFHERDFKIWKAQTDAFVEYGNQVFHSAKLLGSTIGVSCDMCHPNAANTHPETYPKYQEQLQRVALLRDMIDWCIENPIKGKTLDPNDPKMRALEAYILAQRKGVALEYGKH
jgi:hypothetical protein